MREDFMQALNAMILDFAWDPGISDEEIIKTLEAKITEIKATIKRLEGVAS